MASWTMRRDGEVAVLTLDDGKANTFAGPEFAGLEAVLDEAATSDARACVLTGRAGFLSAGLNLKVMAAASLEEKRALVTGMGSSMLKLFLFPKPVVTAVSGHALGQFERPVLHRGVVQRLPGQSEIDGLVDAMDFRAQRAGDGPDFDMAIVAHAHPSFIQGGGFLAMKAPMPSLACGRRSKSTRLSAASSTRRSTGPAPWSLPLLMETGP